MKVRCIGEKGLMGRFGQRASRGQGERGPAQLGPPSKPRQTNTRLGSEEVRQAGGREAHVACKLREGPSGIGPERVHHGANSSVEMSRFRCAGTACGVKVTRACCSHCLTRMKQTRLEIEEAMARSSRRVDGMPMPRGDKNGSRRQASAILVRDGGAAVEVLDDADTTGLMHPDSDERPDVLD